MAREGKTFFEVFSQGSSEKRSKGSGSERPGEDLLVISDVNSDSSSSSSSNSSSKPRRNWRGPYKVGLATIVLGAVGGVFLAVGCFFLGLKLGGHRDLAQAQPKSATVKAVRVEKTFPRAPSSVAETSITKPSNSPVAKVSSTPKAVPGNATWSLRVVSYKEGAKSLEMATTLANVLKERTGHEAFVARHGSQIVVCVGAFDSQDNPKLSELQKLVRELKYEDRIQFAGAYPVKVR